MPTEPIPPAPVLEWDEPQAYHNADGSTFVRLVQHEGTYFGPLDLGIYNGRHDYVRVPTTWLPALLALANAALPSNDPHKLTKRDADNLCEWAEDSPRSVAADMRALAAKLRALLPPDAD
jgi:hypothetical protein